MERRYLRPVAAGFRKRIIRSKGRSEARVVGGNYAGGVIAPLHWFSLPLAFDVQAAISQPGSSGRRSPRTPWIGIGSVARSVLAVLLPDSSSSS